MRSPKKATALASAHRSKKRHSCGWKDVLVLSFSFLPTVKTTRIRRWICPFVHNTASWHSKRHLMSQCYWQGNWSLHQSSRNHEDTRSLLLLRLIDLRILSGGTERQSTGANGQDRKRIIRNRILKDPLDGHWC